LEVMSGWKMTSLQQSLVELFERKTKKVVCFKRKESKSADDLVRYFEEEMDITE